MIEADQFRLTFGSAWAKLAGNIDNRGVSVCAQGGSTGGTWDISVLLA